MLLAALTLFSAQPIAAAPALPNGPALEAEIVARDGELFRLFFEGCDPARLRAMLADDLEFYHDRGGVVFRSGDAMAAEYAKQCEARKAPDAWRSRRERVAEGHSVHPVPGHGAIQDGTHIFYERQGQGPERRVGRARFTQVWTLGRDGWRLSRVLSYAHGPGD